MRAIYRFDLKLQVFDCYWWTTYWIYPHFNQKQSRPLVFTAGGFL